MSLWSTMVVSIQAHGSGVRRSAVCSAPRIGSIRLGPRLVHGALAFWMQTIGAVLFVVESRSLADVPMTARDGRSACGLLYLAAVRRSIYVGHDHLTVDCFASVCDLDTCLATWRDNTHWRSLSACVSQCCTAKIRLSVPQPQRPSTRPAAHRARRSMSPPAHNCRESAAGLGTGNVEPVAVAGALGGCQEVVLEPAELKLPR